MKKKLALILVLVLCVAVVFTMVACKDKDKDKDKDVDQTITVTEAQATAAVKALEEYAALWVLNNSTDTYDRGTDLRNALTQRATINTASGNAPGTVRIKSYNDESKLYTIEASWGDVKKEFTVEAMIADWGNKVGKDYLEDATSTEIDVIIAAIYNAFVATYNDAEAKGQSFSEDGIGFSGKAYFAAGYGGSDNIGYAIQVKGNIGLTDATTALALEILDGEDGVIYGLYFKGAAVKEDCEIYLRAGDKVLYIDNANIVTLIKGLLGVEEEVATALEPIDEFGDLDESGMIGVVLSMLFMQGGVVDVDGDVTTYQARLDLEELFGNIQGLLGAIEGIGDFVDEIIEEYLPAPFNQLNLSTMEGIAGQLTITVVTEDGLITDAELALNMPKRDFRFSATDDVAKVYGPLNFVVGISGFSVGEQTGAIVPDFDDVKEYFSPLNFNFSGDVTVKAVEKGDTDKVLVDSVFSFELLTDINPFNLGAAKGSLVITELKAGETEEEVFVIVMYDQATGDGYLVYKDEGAIELNTHDIFNYIVDNYGTNVEEFITDFIFNLFNRFEDTPIKAAEEEESKFDIFALLDSFGPIQAWYEALVDDEKFLVEIDTADLLSSVISIDLSAADFNAVIALINQIGLLDAIDDLTNPASVEVYFNVEDFEGIFYAKVVVDGKDYVLEIDGSNWEDDSKCYITFSVDALEYVKITIEYIEEDDKEVLVVDADSVYTVIITAEVIVDPEVEEVEYMTGELEVSITKNAEGVLNGFQVTFTDVDNDKYYTVYGEGVAIWTYEKLSGIFDLEFTFDEIPHYGFGFDSNDFSLDVDLDNLYFNWGGANKDIVTIPVGEYEFEDVNPEFYSLIDWLMELLGIDPIEID